MKECPKNRQGSINKGNGSQFSWVSPLDRDAPRGAISGTGGGTNNIYSITSFQEQENSPDFVTSMIKVFSLDVYSLLNLGASLSFVTSYVENNYAIPPEKICEPFCVSISIEYIVIVSFPSIIRTPWLI